MTKIILVRHGQTEWNIVERFRGRVDIPLNDKGLQQAKITGERIKKNWKPVAIYSSPLKRAIQTAQQIAQSLNLKIKPAEGLIDINYGKWQGLTPQTARTLWPELVANWYDHPEMVQIPDGESLKQVRDRAMAALIEICKSHADEQIVLVSHTVINRLILLGVLDLGNERFWHLHQDPCAINLIELSEKGFTLVFMNDTCHLL